MRLLSSKAGAGAGGGAGLAHVGNPLLASLLPTGGVSNLILSPRTCSVIPAPMTYGQPFAGTDIGPDMLLQKGEEGWTALRNANCREALVQIENNIEQLTAASTS